MIYLFYHQKNFYYYSYFYLFAYFFNKMNNQTYVKKIQLTFRTDSVSFAPELVLMPRPEITTFDQNNIHQRE